MTKEYSKEEIMKILDSDDPEMIELKKLKELSKMDPNISNLLKEIREENKEDGPLPTIGQITYECFQIALNSTKSIENRLNFIESSIDSILKFPKEIFQKSFQIKDISKMSDILNTLIKVPIVDDVVKERLLSKMDILKNSFS